MRSTKIRWLGTLTARQAERKIAGKRVATLDRQSAKKGTHGLAKSVRADSMAVLIKELSLVDTGLNYYEVRTGTIDTRESLEAAYRDALAGRYEVLLIQNVKRFFRDEAAAMKWLELLFPLNITVVFVKEELIAPLQEGWQDRFMPEVNKAASESRDSSYKLSGFFALKWELGLPVGDPPYGVTWSPTRVVNEISEKGKESQAYLKTWVWDDTMRVGLAEKEIMPSEAPRLVFQWWREGDHSERSLLKRLRDLGHDVGLRYVQGILRNPCVTGRARRNVSEVTLDEHGRAKRSHSRSAKYETIDLTNVEPPLEERVDVADFEQVQRDLAQMEAIDGRRRSRRVSRHRRDISLFVDVARCSRCEGGFHQMGYSEVEGQVVVRLRHEPTEGKSCFTYTVSERVPEREFYLWQLGLTKPDQQDRWIEAFVREFYKGAGDATNRLKWLDDEEENVRFQLDQHLIDRHKAQERLAKVRHERAALSVRPNMPTDFEVNVLRDGRRIFGDPTVSRELQQRFISTVFETIVFRAPETQHAGPGRPRRERYERGLIDWSASKVRAVYQPLIFAWLTRPSTENMRTFSRSEMCVTRPSPGACAAYAQMSMVPQGYAQFLEVVRTFDAPRAPEMAAA